MDRVRLARLVITVPAFFFIVGPPIADFNASHVANPLWPGHARLHTVWLIGTNALIGGFALAILWGRAGAVSRTRLLSAAALVASVLLGFLVAGATRSLYGGTFSDANGAAPQIGPLDANLAVFGFFAVAVGLAVLSIRGVPDRPT
jgi:hypothetical protein